MKKLVLFFITLGSFFFSQAQTVIDDELKMIKDYLKSEKRDLVKEYMKLDETQSAKFWPLYDEYQAAKGKNGQDRIQIIKDYGFQYPTMTDDQASSLVKRTLNNDKAYTKLQEKYFKKFSKAVSPIKAAQFMQLEDYFRTMIRSEVQDAIPFIGEIERKKG
jgi:vacuolar-type H+-ATPase subunit D/Vma8